MTTTLASQLAQIRACSTNPLDLKAQKKAHSRSLLFEPSVAATQDFESLYQICYEGFQELCRLDVRFAGFADSIFSEQSKHEDRTQMTTTQNQRLDAVLEAFLHLIGGRLLLKPALKAVEWLVRRFRIHQNNTLFMIFTFLPFHTSPIFSVMLSIIPEKLPLGLKFLHPYVQSLVKPPRHAIVHAASINRQFFTTLSAYVLKTCRLGLQYPTLVSFWASIATEAVAAMLDRSRSARLEAQQQNKEDIVRLLLPILNDGLSLGNVPDLGVGCYMILTILASKASLDDGVLAAMMNAITSEWYQTSRAGLICLGVLAEKRRIVKLPRKAFEAIIALENLDDDLLKMSKHHKIERLVLGVTLGIVSRLDKARNTSEMQLLRILLEANFMGDVSTGVVIRTLISQFQTPTLYSWPKLDAQGSVADLILRLCESKYIGAVVQRTIEESNLDLGPLESRVQNLNHSKGSTPEQSGDDVDREEADGQMMTDEFETLASRIPTRTAYEISFLSHSESYVYGSLTHVFLSVYASRTNMERFSDLPVLRKSLGMTEPLFLSFFVRIWCGYIPAKARTAAILNVSNYFRKENLVADVQMLLPYILYALADTSFSVRRSAANLVLVLAPAYERMADRETKDANQPILGQQQIYGQGIETEAVRWLSHKEATRIILDLMVPGLEECMLDESHISQLLSDSLNGPKHSRGNNSVRKELKKTLRLAFFSNICSHVISTPLYAVKFRLLEMLNRISKVGSTSRTKLLLALLSSTTKLNQQGFERACKEGQVDPSELLNRIACIVIPSDREGILTLKSIIESPDNLNFPSLKAAALYRLQTIWASINTDLQILLAEALFELAVSELGSGISNSHKAQAMELLGILPLSTAILRSFLEKLPSISSIFQEKPHMSKRRRTSYGHSNEDGALNVRNSAFAIRQITFVLELIADRKTERHPELLGGLFRIMCDMQHTQGHSVTAVDYLQILAIEAMLPIVKIAEIDHASIRPDVLIDCIRTTANAQVRNSALLLIAALAEVTPESILHSMMPVFTFMGVKVLRQDNDFSAYVVKQTMDSVIPRLVQSLYKRKDGPHVGVSELLLSFVAAYEHIPTQRRLELFVSLANKVGPSDYLFALIAILLDKYPSNRNVMQFATDLTSRYSMEIRVQMVGQLLDLVLDARKPKPTFSKCLLQQTDDVDGVVSHLLPLAPAILSDTSLTSQVSKRLSGCGEDAANIYALFARILEATFVLSEHYTGDKILSVPCMQLLDASLRLLPVSQLIESLRILLKRTESSVCQQALQSFRHRLDDDELDLQASQAGCLAFLPSLASIITESTDVSLKRAAVLCIDRISELFGKKDIAAVVANARTVVGDKCLKANERSLRTISLLCLATMVEVSSHSFVSILPLALPKALDSLTTSIGEDTEDGDSHNAVYSFLGALLIHVPWMLTGTDLALILKLSFKSANANIGEECAQSRIETLRLLPQKLEPKECFAALDGTWMDAMTEGPLAVKEYLELLRLTIDNQPKSVVAQHSETLGGLFLRLFDLRRIHLSPVTDYNYDIAEIGLIEDMVIDSAISMVYKLNDITFRPMFGRILEWTTFSISTQDIKPTIHRQTTWYTFLLRFFSTLKSIVTHYAAFIIDGAVEVLHNTSLNDRDSLILWRLVVLTLQRTFKYDQDDFYQSPSHFAPLSAALLEQLDKAPNIPLAPELIPAITELAIATDSPVHHKEMNTVILKNMRSNRAAVRLAAVQTERALTERLGEEWLALLPEMLPFISEALEDDDEAVEKEVQMWVVGIEEILGESLNPMLQ